ncbi:MAG: serine acetyltransferase [Clostridia bacterium]|nr:serine acetyltransferase [Clostridia bacterium]
MNKEDIKDILADIRAVDFSDYKYFKDGEGNIPTRKGVILLLKLLNSVMFPSHFPFDEMGDTEARLSRAYDICLSQLHAAYSFAGDFTTKPETVADEIFAILPSVKDKLIKDAIAIYEGDPAAVSPEEVILCYPGFYAISIYRIAHEFYKRSVPLISRLMTEFAHEKTGIDIHAGASIGEYFCIDHGTGIVIGETATIGDRVKIYQGVTLGAKSFELGEDGNPIKGTKRHPDIGNRVIIYANATILGGRTHIGDGCIIGAGVWLTSSVEEGKTVYYTGGRTNG